MSKDLPWEGGCRCNGVRFRITAPPLLTAACHCTGCQRMTGSAYSLSMAIPSSGFAVIKGEPVIGGMHGNDRHFFCPSCMSWMFTRLGFTDAFVNVRTTMLDDPGRFVPFMESYTSEKLPWVSVPAVHSYAQFPPPDDIEGLLREFAEAMAEEK